MYGHVFIIPSPRTTYAIISASRMASAVPFVVSTAWKYPMAVKRPIINTVWHWSVFPSSRHLPIHLLPHFEDRSLRFCLPVKLRPLFEVACPPWNQSCASQLSEVSRLPWASSRLSCRQNIVSGTNWELQLNWPCFFPFSGDIVCAVFWLVPDHQYFIYSVVADCLMHYSVLFRTGSPLISFLKKFYRCPSLLSSLLAIFYEVYLLLCSF